MKKAVVIHSNSIIFKIGAPRPYEFLYRKIGKGKLYQEIHQYYERHKASGPLLLSETIENLGGIGLKDYKNWVLEYQRKYTNPSFNILLKFLKQKNFIPIICSSNPKDFYSHFPVKKIFAAELAKKGNYLTGTYIPLTFPYKLDPIHYEPNRFGLLALFYFWAIKNKIDLSWTVLIGPSIPAFSFSYFLGRVIYDNRGTRQIRRDIEKFIKERKSLGI